MSPIDRRRRYWINPRFQKRFLRTVLFLELLVVAAVAAVAGLGWFMAAMSGIFAFTPLAYGFFFVLLAAAPIGAVVAITLRTSSRICGPVYRMIKCIEIMNEGGHPEPMSIRETDYFEELEEAFNDLLGAVEKSRARRTFDAQETPMPDRGAMIGQS